MVCLILDFSFQTNSNKKKKKFQGEGEGRCIADKLEEGKALKNGYSTIQGQVS